MSVLFLQKSTDYNYSSTLLLQETTDNTLHNTNYVVKETEVSNTAQDCNSLQEYVDP